MNAKATRLNVLVTLHSFIVACLLAGFNVEAADLPRSEVSDKPRPGLVRSPLQPVAVEGKPIARVFYDLRGASGTTGGDAKARTGIEAAFGIRAGNPFSSQSARIGLMRVQQLEFVRDASFQVYESDRAGHVVLTLQVELGPTEEPPGPRGVFADRSGDFPVLFQNERAKLTALIDGGFGLFSDSKPWFGNADAFTGKSPIALDPADGASASWFETYVEYGLGGVLQLGHDQVWAYGSVTWLTSYSTGQDLFRSDTRDRTEIETAYGGVILETPGGDWVIDASAGRQSWQLNDGFLFSEFAGAANAGPMPGLYLNPRTAYEMTGLFRARRGDFSMEAFYLDPSEIDFLESDTTFAGLNLQQRFAGGWEASVAYYEVIDSKTTFSSETVESIPRDGQQTYNARVAASRFMGVEGLEFGTEAAYQTHRDVDWDAWAYYGRVGYNFASLPWTPNLSYRYASFSGDDPSTETYERFDAPLSSGLDTWVQGVVIRKAVSNSNLDSHRIRLSVVPAKAVSLTFDYFWLLANETAAGPRGYGQEADFAVRWSINRNLFLLAVAGIALPGERLEDQAGSKLDPWSTYQLSLFWTF